MMGGLARWASAHTGAVVLVAIALAFVTAGSVARCQAIHAPSDAEDAQSPENLAEEELPDEMQALRKTYTNVTKEALGMLAANAWADGQGTAVVTFTDRAIRTTTQGGEEWEAYAVSASARKSVTDEGAASAVTTLCLGTSEWTDIATLTVPQGGDAGAYATFQCPSVCGGSTLTLSPALKEVALDIATIISMVVVWGRGMQLYFMATMSPIPLALLGIDETRQMGVGFLRNYAALVLGYAALSFVVKLFPTLLQMSIATSFVMGGDGEMILSITAVCILEIILTVKCGGWARDVLGG